MRVAAAVKQVLDFCYPTVCAACGVSCPESNTPACCETCDQALRALAEIPACEKCAKPLAYDRAPCPYCEGRGFRPLDQIVCIGVFDDPLKHLIHQAKYYRQWMLAEILVDRLAAQERVQSLLAATEVLIPVPLHPWRQIARGYNQAGVIARQLARHANQNEHSGRLRVRNPAVRTRRTETQTHLHSRAKRVDNLRGAFALVDPASITGRHVTIVDDVMTTGATLRSFARVLIGAKPASISAIVLAIADPRGKEFEAV